MAIGILGRKVGMTQIYDDSGQRACPVTVIQAGPCHVLQVRTQRARRLRSGAAGLSATSRAGWPAAASVVMSPSSTASAPRRRAAAGVEPPPKADCEPKRFVREFRGSTEGVSRSARRSTSTVFADVKAVDVTGTSKGRGSAGVMKRHNFPGQRATHGVKKVHRHAGGTGCSASSPAACSRASRWPASTATRRCTVRNLKVVRVDAENNLLLVRGAVPGPNGGYVVIRANEQAVGSDA